MSEEEDVSSVLSADAELRIQALAFTLAYNEVSPLDGPIDVVKTAERFHGFLSGQESSAPALNVVTLGKRKRKPREM